MHEAISQLRSVARIHDNQSYDSEYHTATHDNAPFLEAIAEVDKNEKSTRADHEGRNTHQRGVNTRVTHTLDYEWHEVAKCADGQGGKHVEHDSDELFPVGHGVENVAACDPAVRRCMLVRGP